MINLKIEGSCHRERIRMAAGNGVIVIVITILALSWMLIYDSSKIIKEKEVKQTAITKALSEAGSAIIVLNEGADVLYWDDNAVKLFGYTKDEIINESVDIIVPHGKRHAELVGEAVGGSPSMETIICEGKTKDGEIIPITIRVHAPFKENQVLIFADRITEANYTER